MALLPQKTYSRRNNDLSVLSDKDKENVDPFDELLSSPLKQEVQFQPLSFWGRKIRRLESKNKNKRVDNLLFKGSDSDEPVSPCQRKWKPEEKCTDSKARKLQHKSRSHKLIERRKAFSTSYSCIKKTKPYKSVLFNNKIMLSTDKSKKCKGWSSNNTVLCNASMEETSRLPIKRCDISDFINVNRCFNKQDFVTPLVISERDFNLPKDTAYFKIDNLGFKIYEDNSTSEKQLCETTNETVVWNSKEDSSDGTIHFNKSIDETLLPFPSGCNYNKSKDTENFKVNNISFKNYEDNSTSEEQLCETTNKTVVWNSKEDSSDGIIHFNKSIDETLLPFPSGCNYNKFKDTESFEVNNISFKNYEDNSTSEQQLCETTNETVVCNSKEDSSDGTIHFNKSIDETLIPFPPDGFKFVSVRRRFNNYPVCVTDEGFSDSVEFSKTCNATVEFNEQKLFGPSNLIFKDVSTGTESLEDINDEAIFDYDDSSGTLCYNENVDCDLTSMDSSHVVGEDSKEISGLEYLSENTVSDSLALILLNDTELGFVQELLNAKAIDGVILESSFASDDTPSSITDEETVIDLELRPEINDSRIADSDSKKNVTQTVSNGVSVLTTSMSELSIRNSVADGLPETKANISPESNYKDKEKNSFSWELRNVTAKRRGGFQRKYGKNVYSRQSRATHQESEKRKETDTEIEFDQSLSMPDWNKSLDWNKSIFFVNPVFESTRVCDMGVEDKKIQTKRFENRESILDETLSGIDRTYALKPGKKWLRSRSVLKQIQNGTITGGLLESTRITGRKFESFVQEMMEIQSEKSGLYTSVIDIPVSHKTLLGAGVSSTHPPVSNLNKTVFELESVPEKLKCSDFCDDTCQEKSSLNHTVKVIQPEERPSAFRTALGLENSQSLLQENPVQKESSVISAKDFILMQCGQEDVLPFEENFNERTLEDCKKIGEGVYGEVFMCSDTVIKIIPIEGSDKVNGEPQKTFAEIISEVVIAAKLSNLRKGKKQQTEGFSELKRCWCVKGKYPKYLLELWEEYDQQGSGSENDSPVMFKDDQLYIILELANGGKDLESFVFSSSAQSLSVFVQAAFSLAAAEKAFEFEHRDLHWGNVLISETKDKFMTVYLDGIEYKIPTKGVKVCIIDFTLSRINHEGCCIFNDLSVDPSLFASEGDYQFEIYRLMLREVMNDWSLFRPKTNLFWLHYTLDKMLKMVRYRNKKAKIHIKHLKDLKTLETVILKHEDSTDFVLGEPFNDVLNKL